MLHMPTPMLIAGGSISGGQQVFLTGGSLIVPADVTLISAVAIGRGGYGWSTGFYLYGGGAGGLSLINGLPVTPGEALDVVMDAAATSLRRGGTVLLRANGAVANPSGPSSGANTTNAVGTATFSGGSGSGEEISMEDNTYVNGGSVSNYSAPGANGGGRGASLLGPSPAPGPYYGAGGSFQNIYGMGASGTEGGAGALRIMWGEGRSYPNTYTGDV